MEFGIEYDMKWLKENHSVTLLFFAMSAHKINSDLNNYLNSKNIISWHLESHTYTYALEKLFQ